MGDWFSDLMQGLRDAEIAANSPTLPGASGVATKLGEVADNAGNTSYVRQPKITFEYGIYPAIGITRVGNQPVSILDDTTFYLGPEIPGWNKWPPASFELKKDTGGVKRIRPQGCRFRVFRRKFKDGAFESEEVLDLSHAEVAKVTWKVNVENTKAAGPIILSSGGANRNPSRRADLAKLKLTPGTKTLVCDTLGTRRSVAFSLPGSGAMPTGFNTAAPLATDTITSLGTAGNDDNGNLIVIGGLGKAVTDGTSSSLTAAFDNDDWFDDIFDGWVSAEVELKDGTKITSEKISQAWVLSAPPDFAPSVLSIVSAWDLLRDIGVRELGTEKALYDGGTFKTTYRPRFDDDIKPILQATWQVFASSGMAQLHSTDFSAYTHNTDPATKSRADLFKKLRKPDGFTMAIGSASGNMPALTSGGGVTTTLTHTQYFLMYQWSQKIVDAGSILPTTITSQGLTRAALEQSIGSALYPGIEFTRTIRNKNWFLASPRFEYRIDASKVAPGDVSQQMALPWQGDFSACGADWWPSVRPDTVKRGGSYKDWDEGATSGTEMVSKWWKLGWVKKTGSAIADYVEADRQLP